MLQQEFPVIAAKLEEAKGLNGVGRVSWKNQQTKVWRASKAAESCGSSRCEAGEQRVGLPELFVHANSLAMAAEPP